MGLLLYAISPFIARTLLHMPEMTNLLRIIAIAFPFIALQKASLGFLNGQRRMKLFAFINIFQNVLVLVLTIILVFLGFGLSSAVWGLVLPVIVASILAAFLLRGYFCLPGIRQHASMIKALLSFGFFVVLTNTISTTQGQINTLLLGFYMTEAEVGYYTTALVIVTGLRIPASAIQLITSPTIATYWGNSDVKAIEVLINRIMKLTALFMLPIVLIVGFLATYLTVFLFGESYEQSALLLQILLAGLLIGSIQTSVGGALASTSYVKVLFRIGIFTLLLSAISNIILIPIYGMTGAAVAHSFVTIISAIVNLVLVQRLVKVKIKWAWFIILVLIAVLIVTMPIMLSI
jgi:O-antigen/teichoic acid export membrane protein